MKNNKGFTMIELLATIVILGLLSAIAVVGISSILNKAEKNHYETQQKNMIMAAQSYVQDNRNVLPKEIGDSRIIMLSELQNRKYIGEVLDRSKIACSNGTLDEGGSYVEIFRYSKDGYSYRPYLKCRQYETGKEEYGGSGPSIELNINTNYNNPSFSFVIEDTEGKIISYSYAIYKYGILVKDSGSVPVSRVGKVEKTDSSLKKLVPGEFEIVFTATNMYGKANTITKTATIEDKDGPTCGDVTPEHTDWQKVPEVTITVGCSDNSGSGCSREIFSEIFRQDTKTAFIEISDNLGNKSACRVGVYNDNTPPTKPVVANPYEDTWINKSYTIKITSTDVTSGVEYFEYRFPDSTDPAEQNWTIYESSRRGEDVVEGEFTFETPEFSKERSEYVEIRACDQVGNCSESTRSMIKIDKTNPTCSNSGGSDTWKNVTVTLVGTCTDDASGCVGNVTKDYATDINVTGQTPGTVNDIAGNSTDCLADQTVKVDKTKPVVSFSTAPGTYDTNDGISVSGSCYEPNDGTTGSGIVARSLGPTSVGSPNSGTSITYSCTDLAGNVGSISGTFKVRYYSRHSDCGVEAYNYCTHSQCGVKSYKYCANSACGTYSCNCSTYCSNYYCEWCRMGRCGAQNSSSGCSMPGVISSSCTEYSKTCSTCNYSCRTSGCGVESYYSCRTSGCGVESYYACWHY